MPACFFVSDLHGRADRYAKLLAAVAEDRPGAVFLGGDLLPPGFGLAQSPEVDDGDFVSDFLVPSFERLRVTLGAHYPSVFVILGNDDPRIHEAGLLEAEALGLWRYVHGRCVEWSGCTVCGYACVSPTPFRLKDWERYDVSRYVDPGCCSPEEGWRTVPVPDVRYGTIKDDLDALVADGPLDRVVMLFHSPPYRTPLDRAALDGQSVDFVPLDVHVGSIAIRRFIEARQPLVTLHGHIHESARITGEWRTRIGRTHALSAAHDGPELALVRFDPDDMAEATRRLI